MPNQGRHWYHWMPRPIIIVFHVVYVALFCAVKTRSPVKALTSKAMD